MAFSQSHIRPKGANRGVRKTDGRAESREFFDFSADPFQRRVTAGIHPHPLRIISCNINWHAKRSVAGFQGQRHTIVALRSVVQNSDFFCGKIQLDNAPMEKLHTDQSVDGLVTGFAYGTEVDCKQFFGKGHSLDIRLKIADAISVSPGMNALHRHPPSEFNPEAAGDAEIQYAGSRARIQQKIQRLVVSLHGDFQPEIPIPILKRDFLKSVGVATKPAQQAESQDKTVETATIHE